jgi:hypothetical protein
MNDSMSYIAKKACGCIVAAVVDSPTHRKDVARETSKWIRAGFKVERVTSQWVRENLTFGKCPHQPTEPTQPSLF